MGQGTAGYPRPAAVVSTSLPAEAVPDPPHLPLRPGSPPGWNSAGPCLLSRPNRGKPAPRCPGACLTCHRHPGGESPESVSFSTEAAPGGLDTPDSIQHRPPDELRGEHTTGVQESPPQTAPGASRGSLLHETSKTTTAWARQPLMETPARSGPLPGPSTPRSNSEVTQPHLNAGGWFSRRCEYLEPQSHGQASG